MAKQTKKEQNLFLSKAYFKGFKSIENLAVDLNPGLNIIIGKNSSGKSNFLECLYLALMGHNLNTLSFRSARLEFTASDNHKFIWETEREIKHSSEEKENLDERIRSIEKLYIDGSLVFDGSKNIRHTIEFKSKKIPISRVGIRNVFRHFNYGSIMPTYIKFNFPETLECLKTPGTLKINLENDYEFWDNLNTLSFIRKLFFDIEMYFTSEGIHTLTKKSFLQQLVIDQKLVDNLRKYTPIKGIRFNEGIALYRDDKNIIIDNLRIDFKIGQNWLPWSQLSDGTKRIFFTISEITSRTGSIVILEEPELGVHPHQLNLIMDFLSNEAESKQIFISTHSPQALNHLSEKELSNILVTSYDVKTGTNIKHLTTSQQRKAKKYMSEVGFLSDYWMLSDLE